MVSYWPAKNRGAPQGAYEVVRPMPADESGVITYRIRSVKEDHERVAKEDEIERM